MGILVFAACGGADVGPDAGDGIDKDGDGYAAPADCDDNDITVHPGATEYDCDDGKDNDCDGETDTDAECIAACELVADRLAYVGCELYGVDLPNTVPEGGNKQFAFSMANYSFTHDATVTIYRGGDLAATLTVKPRSLETFIETDRPLTLNDAAGVSQRSYRIVSDRPVAAYQFNSFDTIGAASTDASLLLPTHVYDTSYLALDYTASHDGDAYVAIIAREDGTEATFKGQNFSLSQGEVALTFGGDVGTNQTGELISASKPVAVFSGNTLTDVPFAKKYRDHLEQQLLPRIAHGTQFVLPKSIARTHCMAEDYARVVADADNTQVSVSAPVDATYSLNKGEWQEFSTMASVTINSNKPVTVGQFLRSSGDTECEGEGDPSFIELPPIGQFRNNYLFVTPPTYESDYIAIIAKADTTVTLDGEEVEKDGEVADSWRVITIKVTDGPHTLLASDPVGLIVYGFGGPYGTGTKNVSYGYTGGLNVERINPNID